MADTLFKRARCWAASPDHYDYLNYFDTRGQWVLGGGQSVNFIGNVAVCEVLPHDPPDGAAESGIVSMVLVRATGRDAHYGPPKDVVITRKYTIYCGEYTFQQDYGDPVTFTHKCVFDEPPAPVARQYSLKMALEGPRMFCETEFYANIEGERPAEDE